MQAQLVLMSMSFFSVAVLKENAENSKKLFNHLCVSTMCFREEKMADQCKKTFQMKHAELHFT